MSTDDMGLPTELNLFAGGGGAALATQYMLKFRTVCYVEYSPLPIYILRQRIQEGYLQDAPIWDDVRTFDGKPWCGLVDIVTAGFPCQDYSVAGRRLGPAGPHNRWPDTLRIIGEVQPRAVLLENVAALFSWAYLGRIFADLAEAGYVFRWADVPAFVVGAPHLRERIWIMAHRSGERRALTPHVHETKGYWRRDYLDGETWWKTEPALGRVAHGLARGLGKSLEPIGEGWVPAVARRVWNRMMEDKHEDPD